MFLFCNFTAGTKARAILKTLEIIIGHSDSARSDWLPTMCRKMERFCKKPTLSSAGFSRAWWFWQDNKSNQPITKKTPRTITGIIEALLLQASPSFSINPGYLVIFIIATKIHNWKNFYLILYISSNLKPEIKQFKIWIDHRKFINRISVWDGFTSRSTNRRRVFPENLHRHLAPMWKHVWAEC